MIVVIDGPAGTGKSTVARKVAERLGFVFFDSGAMYRSAAWLALQRGIDPGDPKRVSEMLPSFDYHVAINEDLELSHYVEGRDITSLIREPVISMGASRIAAIGEVREKLLAIQRKLGHQMDAVFEGRDMGTVVFPDADVKIFLTARPEIRARRRYEEYLKKNPENYSECNYEKILKDILDRDHNDSTRSIAPLKQASDAFLVDTSELTIDEVTQEILKRVQLARPRPPKKRFYAFFQWVARFFFKVCFRMKVFGLEHLRQGAGIIASNHTSHFDAPVLSACCPEEVHFLAKESLFDVPIFGKIIRILNAHPVSRSGTDVSTFRQIIKLLREQKKVVLFPEGTRSEDGQVLPLERGLPFIAIKAGCPIFPVYIHGTHQAWPASKKWPRFFGEITVVFGSPIACARIENMEKKEAEKTIMEQTAQALERLKDWTKSRVDGSPP